MRGCSRKHYHCGDNFLNIQRWTPWQVPQAELPYTRGFHHVLDVTLLTIWILCSQTPSNEEFQLCWICWISRVVFCSHAILHSGVYRYNVLSWQPPLFPQHFQGLEPLGDAPGRALDISWYKNPSVERYWMSLCPWQAQWPWSTCTWRSAW